MENRHLTDKEIRAQLTLLNLAKRDLIKRINSTEDEAVVSLLESKTADTVAEINDLENVLFMRAHTELCTPPRLQNCSEC